MSKTMEEVRVTREFDAPREEVFRAWLAPEEVSAWYGPGHMDVPLDLIRIDPRAGGRWEVTMVPRGGGTGFAIGYEILELIEPELLVMQSDPMPQMGMPEGTTVRMTLEDVGGRTRMVLTDGPMPEEGRAGAEAGYGAALQKLAAHLGG